MLNIVDVFAISKQGSATPGEYAKINLFVLHIS
jgi:hypothetical protein